MSHSVAERKATIQMPRPGPGDVDVIRSLGERLADAAEESSRSGTAESWRRLNDREPDRPMVWITEIPWHEINEDGVLDLHCKDPFLRDLEQGMRRTLFQWDHFRVDSVIQNWLACPKVWHSTGFGFDVQEDVLPQHQDGGISSHHYHPQLTEPEHLEQFRNPVVTYDRETSEARHAFLSDLLRDVLPVRLTGIRHIWFTPWDNLYHFIDPSEFMYDMIDRPEFIHEMVRRYVDTQLAELDQFQALGLLSPGASNVRVGSGGYGYTSDLPGDEKVEDAVNTSDLWGCGNAQIFAEISPDMHWDFSLQYEMRWLERWGANYYGCCEQLHEKIDILRRIPHLRKISASPRCDLRAAREAGNDRKFNFRIKQIRINLATESGLCKVKIDGC